MVFHDAGGGHRSTATALNGALTAQSQPWEVELLNIQELLDSLDVIRNLTGLRIQEAYNTVLRRGWTRLTPQLLVVLKQTIRLYHRQIVKTLRAYWWQHPTDLVLSVIPHFNREIAESLQGGEAPTPFVTLLTDLADYPPHFWIERESQYLIVGTARAKRQALAMGHSEQCIFETSGMVLKPAFYEKTAVDRVSERRGLGLEPECATGVVLFGGHGSRVMVDIARQLDENKCGVQLIMLCGHNQKLAAELRDLKTAKAIAVIEFTANVERYMSIADFFVGKPGPGSISEALQLHLPVITECNSRTLPQERYNAEWITENGFGLVVKDFREIVAAVERLLAEQNLGGFRSATATYSNHALFEVPAILERCLRGTLCASTQN